MADVRELFNLTGKTALITGGSRGLGAEIAEGLAEAGAAVHLPQGELSPERLAGELRALLPESATRHAMAAAASARGHPNAAARIAALAGVLSG